MPSAMYNEEQMSTWKFHPLTWLSIALRVSFLFVLASHNVYSQIRQSEKQTTPIAGTRVSLEPPEGFTPSEKFPGYILESRNSSIMVTEIPGPFSKVSAGFSDYSALTKKGMTVLEKSTVDLSVRSGLLVRVNQTTSAGDFFKWVIIFGDEKHSVVVTALAPIEYEQELSEKLKSSLLTVQWVPERQVSTFDGLDFVISESGNLKLATRMSNMLLFSKSGIVPNKNVDDPIFVVGQSISIVVIGDALNYSKDRLRKTETLKDLMIKRIKPITIDKLAGYEISAFGKDISTGKPMFIYQVMLFEDDGYFMMQGIVGLKNRQPYLSTFIRMARTFKRTKTTSARFAASGKVPRRI